MPAMFQRGTHNNRQSRTRSSGRNHTSLPRGLFANNVWHCDCDPRLPAEHFRVKKDGKNHGRWFYTCQQQEPKRCGFFLWDEDAKPREEAAVLSNSRNEPKGDVQEGWNAGRGEDRRAREDNEDTESPSPPPSYTSEAATATGSKRTAHAAGINNENTDSSFETPRKAQRVAAYPTPATTGKRKLPWIDADPTTPAATESHAGYFSTPSKHQQPQTPQLPPAPTTAATPSPPPRHRDALRDPADDASSLTSEALACLSAVTIPVETLAKLRGILTKHDLKSQGVIKGRDISRLALKAKDAKVLELEARIASMVAEIELERAGGG